MKGFTVLYGQYYRRHILGQLTFTEAVVEQIRGELKDKDLTYGRCMVVVAVTTALCVVIEVIVNL